MLRVLRTATVRPAALTIALTLVLAPGCASWTIPEQEFRDPQAPQRKAAVDARPTAQFGSSDKARSIESNVGIR